MSYDLTGRFRYRNGFFGSRILEVELDHLVDFFRDPHGQIIQSFHVQTWRTASKTLRKIMRQICQDEVSDTFVRIGIN